MRFSTGCVSTYEANGCGGPDLPWCVVNGIDFRSWYHGATRGTVSYAVLTAWNDGDVWGSDFRDSAGGDIVPDGGSDVPDLYFFSGHGICQASQTATGSDFLSVCGDFGKPDDVNIGSQSRWGNGAAGHLRFLFLDASCPMDLASLAKDWFPAFAGLHVATGHSGTRTQDSLDSPFRAAQFAGYTAASSSQFFKSPFGGFGFGSGLGFGWYPVLSVGDAWMTTGLIDVESGCCAVVAAAGETRADAEDRRDNETVWDERSDPVPSWIAWRWICA